MSLAKVAQVIEDTHNVDGELEALFVDDEALFVDDDLDFADDIALISKERYQAQELLSRLKQTRAVFMSTPRKQRSWHLTGIQFQSSHQPPVTH